VIVPIPDEQIPTKYWAKAGELAALGRLTDMPYERLVRAIAEALSDAETARRCAAINPLTDRPCVRWVHNDDQHQVEDGRWFSLADM
jgi:hypothetical protein